MRWNRQIYNHEAAVKVAMDVHAIQVAILPWEDLRVVHTSVLNRKPAGFVPLGKVNPLAKPEVNVGKDNLLATTKFVQIELCFEAFFV